MQFRAQPPRKLIPGEIYNQHVRPSMVITCADAIVVTFNGILLGKRLNPPVQGEYWFPGGRVHKGEGLEQSLITNVKNETGLEVEIDRSHFPVLGDTIFTLGEDRHSYNTTLVVRHIGGVPNLRQDIAGERFITGIDADLHPYVKEVLRRSGVFGDVQRPGIIIYDERDPDVARNQLERLHRTS